MTRFQFLQLVALSKLNGWDFPALFAWMLAHPDQVAAFLVAIFKFFAPAQGFKASGPEPTVAECVDACVDSGCDKKESETFCAAL